MKWIATFLLILMLSSCHAGKRNVVLDYSVGLGEYAPMFQEVTVPGYDFNNTSMAKGVKDIFTKVASRSKCNAFMALLINKAGKQLLVVEMCSKYDIISPSPVSNWFKCDDFKGVLMLKSQNKATPFYLINSSTSSSINNDTFNDIFVKSNKIHFSANIKQDTVKHYKATDSCTEFGAIITDDGKIEPFYWISDGNEIISSGAIY